MGEARGRVEVPGSKSHTNRALLAACCAEGPVLVRGALECDDSDSLLACLASAGVSAQAVPGGRRVVPGPPPREPVVFDVRDSGTACRFLAAFAAASPGLTVTLTGSERLRERPVGPLVEALRRLGAEISYEGRDGYPPLGIAGRRLEGGEAEVDASLSSQFASALLLAAPKMRMGIRLRVVGTEVSRPYLDATVETMASAGLLIRRVDSVIEVESGPATAREIRVPGDYSSAVALAGAVAVRGGELELGNLTWPSAQADAAAFAVLREMGVAVAPADGVLVSGKARRPVSVDARAFPDAVPVLCAVASRVDGESVFSGVEHLRLKESDRIEAIRDMLAADGTASRTAEGEIRVFGPGKRSSEPPLFPTRADHRLVMASALLCLDGGGFVENPRAVEKSYPSFFRDLFRGILP